MPLRAPRSAIPVLALLALAGPGGRTARADGGPPLLVAEALAHPAGGDAVYLARPAATGGAPRATARPRGGRRARQLLWRSSDDERIVTEVRWSRQRDALAFATRDRRGAMTLVVVLVGVPGGHVMTWPIPSPLHPTSIAEAPSVTWLGRERVAFGRSEARPDVVASWRVRK
jgi:hypothetical protein